MNLLMPGDLAAKYRNPSQQIRAVSEAWGGKNIYCPNCPTPVLSPTRTGAQVVDFVCPHCSLSFQLKSQKSKLGKRINDGAYKSMMEFILGGRTPHFYFLHYDRPSWTVRDLLFIPNFAFPPSAIIKRNPLKPTAERAGWIGCVISLQHIPAEARIPIVANGNVTPVEEVRDRFKHLKPLESIDKKERGWTLDVLRVVQSLGKQQFTNDDVYASAPELQKLHPNNRHVIPKIRQQLQVLRDRGFLTQVERGVWAVTR